MRCSHRILNVKKEIRCGSRRWLDCMKRGKLPFLTQARPKRGGLKSSWASESWLTFNLFRYTLQIGEDRIAAHATIGPYKFTSVWVSMLDRKSTKGANRFSRGASTTNRSAREKLSTTRKRVAILVRHIRSCNKKFDATIDCYTLAKTQHVDRDVR